MHSTYFMFLWVTLINCVTFVCLQENSTGHWSLSENHTLWVSPSSSLSAMLKNIKDVYTKMGVGLPLVSHSDLVLPRSILDELITHYFWCVVICSFISILDKWQGLSMSIAVAKAHEWKGASSQCNSKNKVYVRVPTEGGCESWLANSQHGLSSPFSGHQDPAPSFLLNTWYRKQYFLLCGLVCHSDNDICISRHTHSQHNVSM